jgi:hypothetical protein
MTLLTRNLREFQPVPGLTGLAEQRGGSGTGNRAQQQAHDDFDFRNRFIDEYAALSRLHLFERRDHRQPLRPARSLQRGQERRDLRGTQLARMAPLKVTHEATHPVDVLLLGSYAQSARLDITRYGPEQGQDGRRVGVQDRAHVNTEHNLSAHRKATPQEAFGCILRRVWARDGRLLYGLERPTLGL